MRKLLLTLAFLGALAAPPAARADSGTIGSTLVNAFMGSQVVPYASPSVSYGANGGLGLAGSVGDVGGVNYLTTYTFKPVGGSSAYYASTINPVVQTVSGMPTFSIALYTGQVGALANPALAYSTVVAHVTPISTFSPTGPGQYGVGGGSLTQAINAAVSSGSTVTLAITGGTLGLGAKGAGVPAPIAGAGLPFLAAAGLAWARRRRRAGPRGAVGRASLAAA